MGMFCVSMALVGSLGMGGPGSGWVLESDMRRKREVVEGQIYRKLGPSGGFWQVVAIRKDGMGTQHAQLKRTDDPKTLKTLSVMALLDNQQFEIATEA